MAKRQPATDERYFLGLECGGTKTTALAERADRGARLIWKGGPANLRLSTDSQLLAVFRAAQAQLPPPTALAVGMAGARTPADFSRLQRLVATVWPDVPCAVSNDLEIALDAAPARLAPNSRRRLTQVLILSGTGSCCLGRTAEGHTRKLGGWGHILGDKGSAYEIGLRALKAVVYYLDRDGEWSQLGESILGALALNEPEDLIDWVKSATKDQVAVLTIQVFAAASRRDRIARDILTGAAASLAKDALACADRIARANEPVQFVLAGSVLLKQRAFAAEVRARLLAGRKASSVDALTQESVYGAVERARMLVEDQSAPARGGVQVAASRRSKAQPPSSVLRTEHSKLIPQATDLSPTERRNPASMGLDRMALGQAIELFLREDATIPAAIRPHRSTLEKIIRWTVAAFRSGGRLFYVGAGTSGRLGVLDASECPPTFRSPKEWVQGIIAGGAEALHSSIEGAEDDLSAGAQAVVYRGVRAGDVVIGIAASGRTPYVWGALAEARRRGAKTALICCNPYLRFQRGHRPDAVVAVDLGPELLTGSTRLKSGTATKLILNLLTTLSMVRIGKVVSNLMIDLNPSNRKLRGRAIGILRDLTGQPDPIIQAALEASGWRVKEAWLALKSRKKTSQ